MLFHLILLISYVIYNVLSDEFHLNWGLDTSIGLQFLLGLLIPKGTIQDNLCFHKKGISYFFYI